MSRTTPPPPLDITEVFSELRGYVDTTVRLHPRAGSPAPDDSSLGGPLRWPADEPWPACRRPHAGFDTVTAPAEVRTMTQAYQWAMTRRIGTIEEKDGRLIGRQFRARPPDVPVPMVPVLQLRARDVPDLPFPAGTDLLQVLWCPNDHDKPWWRTFPVTVWRRAADVTALLSEPPATRFDEDQFAQSYVPLSCLLHPEPAVEYPHPRDLPTDLRERVEQWDREHDGAYRADLSTAVGTKVGGHPRWIQDPEWPTCDCGARMAHLLTIASEEASGRSRWLPVEDRDDPAFSGRRFIAERDAWAPHGLMLGDVGSMYLFTCPRCEHRPLAGVVQSS